MHRRSNRIRLLLVEDHEIVRVALRVLLERTGDIHVVDEAGTASRAWEQVTKFKPDVVLLDVNLPDRCGVDLCRDIRAAFPNTHVLFLTALPDTETLRASVVGGADGYLHKTIDLESLVEAIKAVASGKGYLDHAAAGSVMSWLRASSIHSDANPALQLSPQERRVIALVAEGKTNKEIGVTLVLSEKTVKNYISHAFEKLGVTRRAQAAVMFMKIPPDTTKLLS
ncbi:MAG: response regulator transcription factor [Nitrospira sp.]|nr:response regulator transcription factor [Nitrospira sp.]